MALIRCPDCGNNVSDSAPTCPHCGRPIAKPKAVKASKPAAGGCGSLIIAAIALVVVVSAMSKCSDDSPSPSTSPSSSTQAKSSEPPAKTEEECRPDLQCWAERSRIDATVACKPQIEAQALHEVKWTDGWLEPMFSRLKWADKAHRAVTYVGDKVSFQNGFSAFTPMTYFCTFDPDSKRVTDVNVIEGRLPAD
jgi:hypothetical protein